MELKSLIPIVWLLTCDIRVLPFPPNDQLVTGNMCIDDTQFDFTPQSEVNIKTNDAIVVLVAPLGTWLHWPLEIVMVYPQIFQKKSTKRCTIHFQWPPTFLSTIPNATIRMPRQINHPHMIPKVLTIIFWRGYIYCPSDCVTSRQGRWKWWVKQLIALFASVSTTHWIAPCFISQRRDAFQTWRGHISPPQIDCCNCRMTLRHCIDCYNRFVVLRQGKDHWTS